VPICGATEALKRRLKGRHWLQGLYEGYMPLILSIYVDRNTILKDDGNIAVKLEPAYLFFAVPGLDML